MLTQVRQLDADPNNCCTHAGGKVQSKVYTFFTNTNMNIDLSVSDADVMLNTRIHI